MYFTLNSHNPFYTPTQIKCVIENSLFLKLSYSFIRIILTQKRDQVDFSGEFKVHCLLLISSLIKNIKLFCFNKVSLYLLIKLKYFFNKAVDSCILKIIEVILFKYIFNLLFFSLYLS